MRGHSVADCAKQARVTRALNMHVHMLEHVHVHVCLHFFPDRITVVFFSKRISDIVYTCLLRHLPRDRRTVLNMLGDMHGHACLDFFPRIVFPPERQ